MRYQRRGLLRAVFIALVPPILVGVVLLLIEYGIFQNGNGDDPTATPLDPGQGEASITLSVDSGPPGTELTISGSGFAPGETIVLRFHTEEVGRVQADGEGAFADVLVQVPGDWLFTGQFMFSATGQTSTRSANLPFEVT